VTASSLARVSEALEGATLAFEAIGIEEPRTDAMVLLSAVTGLDRAELAISGERPLQPAESREFAGHVRRRLRREPVAYVLGRGWFRNLELKVDRRGLVPRPETEMLVDLAVELAPDSVLDVGTGSGAVALAVCDELPSCRVVATDVSPEALDLARENAVETGLSDRVEFIGGTWPADGAFDLVLANLPYVATGDRLPPEVADWEPAGSLFGGPDGLGVIREVLAGLAGSSVTSPVVALEVGEGQAEAVADLLRGAGYGRTSVRPDLAGIERVVVGRKGSPDRPGCDHFGP
jgi:release factor glutamine methyltransferase